MGNVEDEIDRRLQAARVSGSRNEITAAELRNCAVGYLREYDEELARYPQPAGRPHSNLWMMDTDLDDALFAVLVFHPAGVWFACGTGDSFEIRGWDSNDPESPAALVSELRREFRVLEEALVIERGAAEAWLGRGW